LKWRSAFLFSLSIECFHSVQNLDCTTRFDF
jgi:hypothetical protein